MRSGETLVLAFTSGLSRRDPVLAAVREAARCRGFDDHGAQQLELAVDEALVNIVQHGYERGEEGPIEVRILAEPVGIQVVLKDRGLPFDPARSLAPDQGLGLRLLRAMVDQVAFRFLGPEGRECALTKRLPTPHPEPQEEPPPRAARTTPEVAYRMLEPAESLAILRGAYRVFGYTYPLPELYVPEQMAALLASGAYHCAGAVTPEGEVVSHAALRVLDPASGQAEYTLAFADPHCRVPGGLLAVSRVLMDEARRLGLKAIYAACTTSHTLSQKPALEAGFVDTALMVGASHGGWQFKGLLEPDPQRQSLAFLYHSLAERPPFRVVAPAAHRPFLAERYRLLGQEAHFEDGCPDLPPGPPQVHAEYHPQSRDGVILNLSSTQATEEHLVELLRGFRREGAAYAMVRLNMQDPGLPRLVERLEAEGCFLAGLWPSPAYGDWLCLQTLFGERLDYEAIHVASEDGRRLKEHIRHLDPAQCAPKEAQA